MDSVFNSLSLLIVLISSWQVEPTPTLTTQPSNPSFVDEGSNLTLRWTYSLGGTLREATFKRRLPALEIIIMEKDAGGLFVDPSYVNRTQVAISDGETTITLLGVNSSESGDYNFEVQNSARVKIDRDVKITVRVPPRITSISPNQTKNETDELNLMCLLSGHPTPARTWTRLSDSKEVTFPFNITGKGDEGFYRCTANNSVGDPVTSDVYVTVEHFHPINTNLSTNLRNMTVVVNTSFNLICSALANPPADYRFFKGKSAINTTDSDTYTTSVGARVHQVTYSCTPFNFYGNGREKTITVTVHCRCSWATANLFYTRNCHSVSAWKSWSTGENSNL